MGDDISAVPHEEQHAESICSSRWRGYLSNRIKAAGPPASPDSRGSQTGASMEAHTHTHTHQKWRSQKHTVWLVGCVYIGHSNPEACGVASTAASAFHSPAPPTWPNGGWSQAQWPCLLPFVVPPRELILFLGFGLCFCHMTYRSSALHGCMIRGWMRK